MHLHEEVFEVTATTGETSETNYDTVELDCIVLGWKEAANRPRSVVQPGALNAYNSSRRGVGERASLASRCGTSTRAESVETAISH